MEENVEVKYDYSSYDLLLAIDSEKFLSDVRKVKEIETHWRKKLGPNTFQRNILKKNNQQILYSYKDNYPPYYSGFEGFYSKRNYGYHLRAITSRELFLKYKTKIMKIINSFKI